MARLKSLNLRLKFHTSYNTHPVIIKYKGLIVKNDIDIFLENVDQKEFIEFSGFDHEDRDQQVTCSIFYDGRLLDINVLCSFQMKNNKYVNNIKLSKCHKIYFNGELELNFFKEWFECNLLSGICMNHKKTGYIKWTTKYEYNKIDRNRINALKNYDIICIGASIVHGTEQLDKSKAWPKQLQNMLNLNVGNFGVPGNDHFGVLHNIEYVINKFNVKKIIVLLPSSFILPKRVEFLGKYVFLQAGYNIKKKYLFFNSEKEAWQRKNILKETFIKKFLSKKLKKIEQMCADRNIDLSLIYQHVGDCNSFNYSSTRFENFVFPEYSAKQSLENNHPDETVHLKFAKQLVEKLFKI